MSPGLAVPIGDDGDTRNRIKKAALVASFATSPRQNPDSPQKSPLSHFFHACYHQITRGWEQWEFGTPPLIFSPRPLFENSWINDSSPAFSLPICQTDGGETAQVKTSAAVVSLERRRVEDRIGACLFSLWHHRAYPFAGTSARCCAD